MWSEVGSRRVLSWTMSTTAATHDFAHEAFLYAGENGFLAGTLPFIRDGLAAGEPVLLVLTAAKLDSIRAELGPQQGRLRFANIDEVGVNPARIIPLWREFVGDWAGDGRSARGIGEPIEPGLRPAELAECQRHESLLNLAFAEASGFRLLCPYDSDSLHERVIEEALRSHPCVREQGETRASPLYRGLEAVEAQLAEPLPGAPPSAEELRFRGDSLDDARGLVARRAADEGLSAARVGDLVQAVNEVTTNSIRHGGGDGTLRIWIEDAWLLCEVEDRGRIDDPLVGRERPGPMQPDGRGLWIANHACELVQVRTSAAGSTVRLHMRRSD
jgi:anti-sigma regulatory factor (Ser/Thr protein kinase)